MRQIEFTVPLIPPSVGHYKVPLWKQRRFYVTAEAKAFKEAVWACAPRSRQVFAKSQEYYISIRFYLGKKQRLDGDNGVKCVFDGLQEAGLIHSDAFVMEHTVRKGRDWKQPRTEILVRYLEGT